MKLFTSTGLTIYLLRVLEFECTLRVATKAFYMEVVTVPNHIYNVLSCVKQEKICTKCKSIWLGAQKLVAMCKILRPNAILLVLTANNCYWPQTIAPSRNLLLLATN